MANSRQLPFCYRDNYYNSLIDGDKGDITCLVEFQIILGTQVRHDNYFYTHADAIASKVVACEFEIAYRLQESNWGKGLGKEIAEKLIDFCFETFDYERLFAYVMEENIGSKKILDKIMNYKGEVKSKENLSKSFIYEIEKENWGIYFHSRAWNFL